VKRFEESEERLSCVTSATEKSGNNALRTTYRNRGHEHRKRREHAYAHVYSLSWSERKRPAKRSERVDECCTEKKNM
jgi:hypothetical protein